MKRLFALLFLLIGVGLLYFNAPKLRDAHASKGWPTTSGIIEASSVTTQSTESTRDAGDRRPTETETYYTAAITYRYTVDGRERHSSRLVRHELSSRFSGTVEATVKRYPVSAAVIVHYDPSSPDMAVLETSYGTMLPALAVAGLLFSLMGLGGLVSRPGTSLGHMSPEEARAYLKQRSGK